MWFLTLSIFISYLELIETQTHHPCPTSNGYVNETCQKPGAVFILDTTAYLTETEIISEIDFVRNNVLPEFPSTPCTQTAMMSYGTGITDTNPFTCDNSEQCRILDTIQMAYLNEGSYYTSLVLALQVYQIDYYNNSPRNSFGQILPVFLFSGSKNQTDIDLAANFARNNLPNADIYLITFQNAANFQNFPYKDHTTFNDVKNRFDYVSLLNIICGYMSASDFPPTQSDETTTIPQTTTEGVTRPPVYTTQSSSTYDNSTGTACQCNPSTIWNDVIFLFESSDALQFKGLDDMWMYILSSSDIFNIQKYTATELYHMRVGVIVYSETAQIIVPLGTATYNDLYSINLPFLGGGRTGVNIKAAIDLAVSEFESSRSRKNARPVIVLMANTYNPYAPDAPLTTMNAFHEDDGISIVFNYVPYNGLADPLLNELASPGYYIDNLGSDRLQFFLCAANCFCRRNYYYRASSMNYPTNGCFMPVTIPANKALAERNCRVNYNEGTLPRVGDITQNQFLSSLIGDSYFLGLNQISGSYYWSDGTKLAWYQPWSTPPNLTNGQCVLSDVNSKWSQTDCKSGHYYICQTQACDSTSYCDDIMH